MANLFFGLRPCASARPDLCDLAAEWSARQGGKAMGAEVLHVSLLGIADDLPEIARALRAAGQVRHPPFKLDFNRLMTFGKGRRRPLVLTGDEGVIGVETLREAIGAAMGRPLRAFCPHVSLVWGGEAVDAQPAPVIGWWVREFVLIRSHVGEARHELLERWPLSGAGEAPDPRSPRRSVLPWR